DNGPDGPSLQRGRPRFRTAQAAFSPESGSLSSVCPVSKATESVVFNAVPLLVLAAAYLTVGAALAPTLWRERAHLTAIDAALARLSNGLVRTETVEDVARVLIDSVTSLFGVEFAALSLLSEDGKEARGILARKDGADWPWWSDVRFDLERDPSGIASAAFEG